MARGAKIYCDILTGIMISFSGTVGRSTYWKYLAAAIFELFIVSLLFLWLIDIQNAEMTNADILNQALSIIFLVLLVVNYMYIVVLLISIVVRRAREAGNTTLWTLVAILIPFGQIIIGFIPKSSDS